jgi:hypothetical protein
MFSFHTPSTVAKRLARRFTFGRSRVLNPVLPDQVWFFFRGFPTPSHRGMPHITDKGECWVSINLSYLPPSFRTHLHRTLPNLPVSMAEKALQNLQLGGGAYEIT